MKMFKSASVFAAILALVPRWAAGAEPIHPEDRRESRIGVFLRCTGIEDPRAALAAVKSLGLEMIQVSRLPDRFYTPQGAEECQDTDHADVHGAA